MKNESSSGNNVNRREFIKTVGVAATAGSLAPYVLADDKSGTKLPIVGSGDYQYEVIHDWGTLPEGHVYGNTHGVTEDSQGRIFIKHTVGKGATCQDAVVIFDATGKFIKSWGSEYKGGAHGLHLNKEGGEEFLYLCDPNRHLVAKTDLDGKEIWHMFAPESWAGYTNPDQYRPTNIATAPNGDFYVADGYGKSFIHQYDSKAKYIRTFGGKGKEPGQTDCPHGLMIDMRGTEPMLLVADRANRRLQYFTLDGKHSSFVTDELRAPCHFHTRGEMLLIPDLESRVTLFDKNNKLIAHLGDGTTYNGIRDKSRDHFTPGKFVAPHSAFFDHSGNIFVVEWVEVGRVTKLRKLA
ncbi:MAG: repeat containing protein [Pedosphaera sp.]|nr:repeat containing protein [Pedosphaera sp.]